MQEKTHKQQGKAVFFGVKMVFFCFRDCFMAGFSVFFQKTPDLVHKLPVFL